MLNNTNRDNSTLPANDTSQTTSVPETQCLLHPHQIPPLVTGMGAFYATDLITVKGRPVGVMLHDVPACPDDSGWRFFAGPEYPQWVDDPKGGAIVCVNSKANHDPSIIPFLDEPVGSVFAREEVNKWERSRLPAQRQTWIGDGGRSRAILKVTTSWFSDLDSGSSCWP
jgi:hypothetical protein